MAVFKIHHNDNYTVISNSIIRDSELSLKSKGLLLLVMSLPIDWDYSIEGMAKICKEGKDAIQSGFAELEECGYLVRTEIKERGKFKDVQYDFYEERQEKPYTEKPYTEKPHTEKPSQLSKDLTSKDKKSKETSNSVDFNSLLETLEQEQSVETNDKLERQLVFTYIENFRNNSKQAILRDAVYKWYTTVGIKNGFTQKQLEAKLKQLQNDCNGDIVLMQQAIDEAYQNGYKKFVVPKQNSYSNSNKNSSIRDFVKRDVFDPTVDKKVDEQF